MFTLLPFDRWARAVVIVAYTVGAHLTSIYHKCRMMGVLKQCRSVICTTGTYICASRLVGPEGRTSWKMMILEIIRFGEGRSSSMAIQEYDEQFDMMVKKYSWGSLEL